MERFNAEERICMKDAIIEIFTNLNNITRWPSFLEDRRYNELNKLGLQTLIALSISQIMEYKGKTMHWEEFPKFAIFRAAEKAIIGNTMKSQFDWTGEKYPNLQNVADVATEENYGKFLTLLGIRDLQWDSLEGKIFKLAGKLASQFELDERAYLRPKNNTDYSYKKREIREYKDILKALGRDWKKVKCVLREASIGLRQTRWKYYCRTEECAVLGHCFETAVLAYIMSIENECDEPTATKNFAIGLIHDFPETWTIDMSSRFKDAVPGLRKATHEYEEYILEKRVYPKIPKPFADALKELFSHTEEKFFKGADNTSAARECLCQYWGGTNDPRFRDAVNDIEKDIGGKIEVSLIGRYIIMFACRSLNQL